MTNRRRQPESPARSVLMTAALLCIAALFILPLAWMGVSSLKPADQVLAADGSLLPRVMQGDAPVSPLRPFWWKSVAGYAADNFAEVWTSPAADFPMYLRNSLVVALLSVIGMVAASSIAAYGFARIQWRGRDGCFALVLASMMIPFPVIMVPLYMIFRSLGWIGSLKPLWVPAWFGGAFSVFLLRQFFRTIPRELDEAAMIDGCSHAQIFWCIILPLSRPALVAVALFQFIASWNDFVAPLIFLNHEEQYTLALGLYMFESQQTATPWNLVMAASVLVMLPVLALFMLAQRTFVEGIATGGLKH